MRIQSTYEVNTHYQENPFAPEQNSAQSHTDQSTNRSFSEYLQAQLQAGNTSVNGTVTTQVAGLLMGLQPLLKVQPKPEPSLEDIA